VISVFQSYISIYGDRLTLFPKQNVTDRKQNSKRTNN